MSWLVARGIIKSFAKYSTEDLCEISQPRSQLSEILLMALRKKNKGIDIQCF